MKVLRKRNCWLCGFAALFAIKQSFLCPSCIARVLPAFLVCLIYCFHFNLLFCFNLIFYFYLRVCLIYYFRLGVLICFSDLCVLILFPAEKILESAQSLLHVLSREKVHLRRRDAQEAPETMTENVAQLLARVEKSLKQGRQSECI